MPKNIKKIISIIFYSTFTLVFYNLLYSFGAFKELYSSWSESYLALPLIIRNILIVMCGFTISHLFKSVGAYYVEFDSTHLIKKQQKGISVLRVTVLVTIVMWIIFYQNLTFTWSIFLSSIHIFLLIYIGKIIANKGYLFFYLNYMRAIFRYPQLYKATEETSFNETPIKFTIHDKYNRVATAQKLKDKLTGYDGKSFRRIALVGDFGTGKSSTLNMLEELINKEQYYKKEPNEKWLFVHFDAWGKANNSNDIQGQLLEEVIFNLSKTIETSSVRELPKQYLSAMKDVHISSRLFSNFLSGVFSAEQQLEDLNLLLIENNLRLCIFIEDMDRNHDVIKVTNSIAPLLDNFKSTNKISFIFALGYSDGATQIISRVTDYREDLPPIDFTEEIKILASEQHKLANLKRVELFYEKTNSDWLLNKRCYRASYARESVSTIKVIKILNQLIASAREFEAIKREVISSWSLLIGEFNFDDLLILTTLKTSCPLVYDFIHINIQSLQAANNKEDLLKSWDAIDFNQMTYKKDISFKLVSYLFPMLSSSSNNIRSQSIAENSVKNYWNIYLNSSSKINIEFSDQVLFNQMKQFDDQVLQGGNIAFIDKMVGNPQFVGFIKVFYNLRADSFNDDFWQRVLLAHQERSSAVKELIEVNRVILNQNELIAESLLKNISYISKEDPIFKKHFSWAIKSSLVYCKLLINNENIKGYNFDILFTELFLDEVANFSEFANLIKGHDKYVGLLRRSLVIEQINSEPVEGYGINPSDRKLDIDINKKLHKLLFKLALNITNESNAIELYHLLLNKNVSLIKSESAYTNTIDKYLKDIGAIELLTDKNIMQLEKLSLCEYGQGLKIYLDPNS
ncbi:hypothetical protein EU508_10630 [Pseudoalteromonas fuliginea]|uniref:KAP NTPase domain-containing protein n=1 Tax=Pseudoalteromonas fuliginea TaxID=1872678 RepID=A0AB73BGN2_9GAMM|nr:P-loop NTPase fold protein [Pseudoalteromonas fuliginea]KAA1160198.1 hypothetical protein EU508_10630 [Pseudoalteromonas fuliginea]